MLMLNVIKAANKEANTHVKLIFVKTAFIEGGSQLSYCSSCLFMQDIVEGSVFSLNLMLMCVI